MAARTFYLSFVHVPNAQDIRCDFHPGIISDTITLTNIMNNVLTNANVVVTYDGKQQQKSLSRWRSNQSVEFKYTLARTDRRFTVDIDANEGAIGFQYDGE